MWNFDWLFGRDINAEHQRMGGLLFLYPNVFNYRETAIEAQDRWQRVQQMKEFNKMVMEQFAQAVPRDEKGRRIVFKKIELKSDFRVRVQFCAGWEYGGKIWGC